MSTPKLEPFSHAGLLVVFTARANATLAAIPDRAAAAGLPPEVTPELTAELALTLAGVRNALTSWTPRPPITDPDEEATLLAMLDEALAIQVAQVYSRFTDRRNTATAQVRRALQAWNAARPVVAQDKPSPDARAAMREPPKEDTEHMERIDLGNGRFMFDYRLLPDNGKD